MSTDHNGLSTGHEGPALAAQVAQAVSGAVSEALGTKLQPVLSRRITNVPVPEITWRLDTAADSPWILDGLGPVRVSAQLAVHDGAAIREFIDEIARTFGGEYIRDVRPPFPDGREVRNVEVAVVIEGIPVTVWGTTASPTD